ncbi:MAG: hypothetical protein ACMUIE_04830 [Thermoplasmatota archaeon]
MRASIRTIAAIVFLGAMTLSFNSFSQGQEEGSPALEPEYDALPSLKTVGEDISIEGRWEGLILLEVQYPGDVLSWILEPSESKGGEFEFELPGPYLSGNLSWRHYYSIDMDSNLTNTTKGEWRNISITGYKDENQNGLEDSWEKRFDVEGSSSSEDRDRDGLTNIQEMANLSNPRKADSDGDEMEDSWEAEWGTLPFRYDAYGDPDLDGWSNIKEMVEETDPRNPDDHPEEPPATAWYWILLIFLVMIAIIAFFVRQMFSKKKFEEDMEDFDTMARDGSGDKKKNVSGKV